MAMPAYWALVEPYWEAINIYDGPELFRASYNRAPLAVGLLFAAHWCEHEVCNGGFKQFFVNATGVLAPEALKAYRAIGQLRVAKIVEEAMLLLGPTYPRDRSIRRTRLTAEVFARLDELDDSYYAIRDIDGGGFDVAANAYASSHGEPGVAT